MLSAKKIAAGKSGQIEARIKTENLTGAVEKRITISTNDPHSSSITLTIKAVIEPEIGTSNSEIFFDNIPTEKEATKDIVLTVTPARSIRILSAVSKNPDIRVKLDPAQGSSGKKWKLTAVHRANTKPGYFFGQIVVKTDSKLNPEFSIYTRGTVAAGKK